jgi:methyl-accepting chemotaxis protein
MLRWFQGLAIRSKMLVGYTLVACIAGLVGFLAIQKMQRMAASSTAMYEKSTTPLGTLVQLGMASQKARVNLRGMMLDTDRDRMEANADGVRKRYEDVERLMLEFEKSIDKDADRMELDAVKSLLGSYKPVWQEVIRLQLADSKAEAFELVRSQALGIEKSIEEAIRKLIEIKVQEAKSREAQNSATARSAVVQTVAVSVSGVLLAILFGFVSAGMITRPIRRVVDLSERIADGDLTAEVSIEGRDETAQLARAMNAMTRNLNDILATVISTSAHVADSAAELNSTAEQIANGSEQVAAQAVTVATAGEEMAATSNDIASSCSMAVSSVNRASHTAQNGSAVVQQTVEGMSRIALKVEQTSKSVESLGARSDQIGEIIMTIQDIADQTNLLALNAAIEAARAGEQGRGFAVVADEVRALAERTSRATREIGEMIKAIQNETRAAVKAMKEGVEEVGRGTEDAARSGHALQEILEQVSEVTTEINQIATAAEEQTATTAEISNNIHQMTSVIQGTAQGASQSAAAAARLSGLATDLQGLVNRFRLKT